MLFQRLFNPRNPDRHAEELMASLLVMAWMVEARDPYTGGHLWRVSRYARLLSQHMGLPAGTVDRISIGGFLHDLGKIGIPDHILNKRERLSDEEYEVIKTHPNAGLRMLAGHPLKALVQDAVALQRATTGLAPEARVTLQRAEAALKKNLRVPLRELFCPVSPAEAVQSEDRPS